jgi:hypothetical protein
MIYKWKTGFLSHIDAQEAGTELERIRVQHNGHLTPDNIVRAAKRKTSPIHGAFEWDDKRAAMAHRKDQAKFLIRSIVVVEDDMLDIKEPVRAFVSVRVEDKPHYTSIATAMSDEELRQQVLQKAWRELSAWRETYEDLHELSVVHEAIREVESIVA